MGWQRASRPTWRPLPVEVGAKAEPPRGEPPAAEAPIAVPPPRLDRITAAVRLTRQAVDAWASVILPAGEQPTDSDSL